MSATTSPQSLPILVTGGAGFIGSAVCAALLERGLSVIAMDSQLDQGRLAAHPRLERVRGDVRDQPLVASLVARSGRVFHLAAIAGVHHYMSRPLDVIDINFEGSRHVFDAAAKYKVPVLFSSTSEAYGKNAAILDEDSDTVLGPPTRRRWCYSTSKLLAEHYGYGMADRGLDLVVVRYFNVYGPRLDAPGTGRVLSQFLGALTEDRPLTLVDGGGAIRCFCYVDDAVAATVKLGLEIGPETPWRGTPFNIGNPDPYTMKQLAHHVLRLSGSNVGTIDVPGETFFGRGFEEIGSRIPDVQKLHQAIGFQTSWDLERGLKATLDHWGLLAPESAPMVAEPIPAIKPCFDADNSLSARMRTILDSGWATNNGPTVRDLERRAAAFLEVSHCAAVNSCASGLLVAGLAAGLRGGKVILPSWTYVATLNAVELLGCEPVLCDVDPDSWVMTPAILQEALRRHPDAVGVIPVNTFGVHVDMAGLRAIAGVDRVIIYDNAHGFGSTREGQQIPSGADATVFSLHATKILPATEGGLITTDNPRLFEACCAVRAHGLGHDHIHARTGYNAKMDELSAAVALHGLARLPDVMARRAAYAHRIREVIASVGWTPQAYPQNAVSNGQNLGVITPLAASEAQARFARQGVEARQYFHPPMHLLRRAPKTPALPATERLLSHHLCLPLHSRMSNEVLQRIESAVRHIADDT